MRRYVGIFVRLAAGIFALAGSASAETLDLTCTNTDGSQSYHVAINLVSGVVSNGAGYAARRWPGIVSDKDVSWDEVFDRHIGHVAHHYVFERASGVLRGTDMDSGHEILNLACRKTS